MGIPGACSSPVKIPTKVSTPGDWRRAAAAQQSLQRDRGAIQQSSESDMVAKAPNYGTRHIHITSNS